MGKRMRILYKCCRAVINFKTSLTMATLFLENYLSNIFLYFSFDSISWTFRPCAYHWFMIAIYDHDFKETKVTQGRHDQETIENNKIPFIDEKYIKT